MQSIGWWLGPLAIIDIVDVCIPVFHDSDSWSGGAGSVDALRAVQGLQAWSRVAYLSIMLVAILCGRKP